MIENQSYPFLLTEGQCILHLLNFYFIHPGLLHNYNYWFENHLFHVYGNHVSYHLYHPCSLSYFYMEVESILMEFLFPQCYYQPFLLYLCCLDLELFYSLGLKFLMVSFFFFLGIRLPSSDAVIVEHLRSSCADLFVLIVIFVGSCSSVSLSFELANGKYIFFQI